MFKIQVELKESQAYDYIKKQAINIDEKNGWATVNFLGCSIGGGKIVNGLLKNHYPKGLALKN